MDSKFSLAIVIPVFNGADTIRVLVEQLVALEVPEDSLCVSYVGSRNASITNVGNG